MSFAFYHRYYIYDYESDYYDDDGGDDHDLDHDHLPCGFRSSMGIEPMLQLLVCRATGNGAGLQSDCPCRRSPQCGRRRGKLIHKWWRFNIDPTSCSRFQQFGPWQLQSFGLKSSTFWSKNPTSDNFAQNHDLQEGLWSSRLANLSQLTRCTGVTEVSYNHKICATKHKHITINIARISTTKTSDIDHRSLLLVMQQSTTIFQRIFEAIPKLCRVCQCSNLAQVRWRSFSETCAPGGFQTWRYPKSMVFNGKSY